MIGQQIGNYRIDGEHARGAMGVVYLATDMRLDRPAILKLPVPELLAHARARDRFEREARAASALDHPNICTIYQVGELDLPDSQGQLFIAMAYYEGQTLAAKLAGGPLKPAEVADWVRQIAAGLQAAHRQGIIHRDIKAANIIITDDGRAKILDFGLAKLRDLPDPSSQGLVGTPAYLPPEILRGREADSRSDLFSLAVLSYEMLTGRVPFAELRGPALLNALLNRQPEPPSVHLGALQSPRSRRVGQGRAQGSRQRTGKSLADGRGILLPIGARIGPPGSRPTRCHGGAPTATHPPVDSHRPGADFPAALRFWLARNGRSAEHPQRSAHRAFDPRPGIGEEPGLFSRRGKLGFRFRRTRKSGHLDSSDRFEPNGAPDGRP